MENRFRKIFKKALYPVSRIPYPVSHIPYPLLKKEEKIETIEKHSFIMYFLFIECNSFVTPLSLYRNYTLGQEGIQETQLFCKGYKVFQDFSEIFLTCCRIPYFKKKHFLKENLKPVVVEGIPLTCVVALPSKKGSLFLFVSLQKWYFCLRFSEGFPKVSRGKLTWYPFPALFEEKGWDRLETLCRGRDT